MRELHSQAAQVLSGEESISDLRSYLAMTPGSSSLGAADFEREFRIAVNEFFNREGRGTRIVGERLLTEDPFIDASYYWAVDRYENISGDVSDRMNSSSHITE